MQHRQNSTQQSKMHFGGVMWGLRMVLPVGVIKDHGGDGLPKWLGTSPFLP